MYKTMERIEKAYIGDFGGFAAALAVGFVLAESSMAGVASFADIAISGAVGLPAASAIFTGSLIRSIAVGAVGNSIVKISALAIIIIMKLFAEPKNSPKMCGINTAAAVFLSGAAVSAVIGELLYKLVFYLFYSAVAGFTAYSLSYIITGAKRDKIIDLTSISGCAYAIVYTVLTASLCSVKIPIINIGIVFGTALTMLGAYHYRSIGGVVCGALTVCGAFLSSQETGMAVVLLPVTGLLCGYIKKQKPISASACFAGINFLMMVTTGAPSDRMYGMINIICASALFMAVSPKFSDKWLKTGIESSAVLSDIIEARMNFLSHSIENIRCESARISMLMGRKYEKKSRDDEIYKKICEDCFRKSVCWEKENGKTEEGFVKLEKSHELSAERFPKELEYCLHKKELTEEYKKQQCNRMTEQLLDLRVEDSRKLLNEQIGIMSGITETAGERLEIRYSEPISRKIRGKLESFGFNPYEVIAYYNASNRLIIELYFSDSEDRRNCVRICDIVSDSMRIHLEYSETVNLGKEFRLRLYEPTEYSIDVYGASVCAEGCSDNGDASLVFDDGTGISYVLLSDGMGSGRRAAVESNMVVRMFRSLITGGADYITAVRIINSVMLTKSQDEIFATLDAARIDLDNCGLTMIKSGAAATLIRHRGSVMKITSSSFPIGIYEQTETFSKEYEIEEGDIVMMFSDGIDEGEYRYIKELLLGGDDLKHMVDEICTKAELFRPTVHKDDVTVIGIKISKNQRCK